MGVVGVKPDLSANLYVGQNRKGQWIVTDGVGRRGAIFAQRRDALRFAASLQRVASVFMVPSPIDLSFGCPPAVNPQPDGKSNEVSTIPLTGSQRPAGYDGPSPAGARELAE